MPQAPTAVQGGPGRGSEEKGSAKLPGGEEHAVIQQSLGDGSIFSPNSTMLLRSKHYSMPN